MFPAATPPKPTQTVPLLQLRKPLGSNSHPHHTITVPLSLGISVCKRKTPFYPIHNSFVKYENVEERKCTLLVLM